MTKKNEYIVFTGFGYEITDDPTSVGGMRPGILLDTDHCIYFYTPYLDSRYPGDGRIVGYAYRSDDYIRAMLSKDQIVGVGYNDSQLRFN